MGAAVDFWLNLHVFDRQLTDNLEDKIPMAFLQINTDFSLPSLVCSSEP